jgi:Ser/Thr protein kinase RdoA (MazF antagonist)
MSAPDSLDPAATGAEVPPYAGLTPTVALEALESVGLAPSGQVLALNSYENRVFQMGLDEPHEGQSSVVAKFYRPGRWSDAQILEEHEFVAEIAATEVPAVPPLVLAGATLHHAAGFRFAVFARRGGRAPNLDDRDTLRWLGRFLARIHAVGARRPFKWRPALDVHSYGEEPLAWLLEHRWLPAELAEIYRGVARQALAGVSACYARAGQPASIRLHGDVHEGNVLWTDSGPHFVDFDDSRSAPAVQDLWMLLGGREEAPQRLNQLLEGYEQFRAFDRRELHLIEALRTLRLIQHSAWIARRWHDPAFPAAFPWFDTPRYWEARVLELREQIAAMDEPPLEA